MWKLDESVHNRRKNKLARFRVTWQQKIRGRWVQQHSQILTYERADQLSDALEHGLSLFAPGRRGHIREIYIVRV